MKKQAGEPPILAERFLVSGAKADSPVTRSTSSGPTGNGAAAPRPQWSVDEAVEVAKVLWRDRAATVVAWSALSAHFEGETREYRFWVDVFKQLQADPFIQSLNA